MINIRSIPFWTVEVSLDNWSQGWQSKVNPPGPSSSHDILERNLHLFPWVWRLTSLWDNFEHMRNKGGRATRLPTQKSLRIKFVLNSRTLLNPIPILRSVWRPCIELELKLSISWDRTYSTVAPDISRKILRGYCHLSFVSYDIYPLYTHVSFWHFSPVT